MTQRAMEGTTLGLGSKLRRTVTESRCTGGGKLWKRIHSSLRHLLAAPESAVVVVVVVVVQLKSRLYWPGRRRDKFGTNPDNRSHCYKTTVLTTATCRQAVWPSQSITSYSGRRVKAITQLLVQPTLNSDYYYY